MCCHPVGEDPASLPRVERPGPITETLSHQESVFFSAGLVQPQLFGSDASVLEALALCHPGSTAEDGGSDRRGVPGSVDPA
jgi:hypothetical protein